MCVVGGVTVRANMWCSGVELWRGDGLEDQERLVVHSGVRSGEARRLGSVGRKDLSGVVHGTSLTMAP